MQLANSLKEKLNASVLYLNQLRSELNEEATVTISEPEASSILLDDASDEATVNALADDIKLKFEEIRDLINGIKGEVNAAEKTFFECLNV